MSKLLHKSAPISWDFDDQNHLVATPAGAVLQVTEWDENKAWCKFWSTRHGCKVTVADIVVNARPHTQSGGGGVLCEAREIMSALYWSWRRSSGPGGGADDAPPEALRLMVPGDYKGRLRHG
uniref:Uncharacterized protein n=1 Tax=viral metagenome TaxID=1070528 RepID=A0A6H1Z9V8_9ZZZZ